MNINVSHIHNVLRTYKHLTTSTPVQKNKLDGVLQNPSGPVPFSSLVVDRSDERERPDPENAM